MVTDWSSFEGVLTGAVFGRPGFFGVVRALGIFDADERGEVTWLVAFSVNPGPSIRVRNSMFFFQFLGEPYSSLTEKKKIILVFIKRNFSSLTPLRHTKITSTGPIIGKFAIC